jgi:hypothetical protein
MHCTKIVPIFPERKPPSSLSIATAACIFHYSKIILKKYGSTITRWADTSG